MIGGVLGRFSRWTVRRAGETNLLLLTLLLLAVASTALGVADRVRGVDRLLGLTLAALGLFAGWLIGLTTLSTGGAAILFGVLGLGVVLLRVGRLEAELLALSRACSQLVWEGFSWTLGDALPSGRPVWMAWAELREGTEVLSARVASWAGAVVAGDPRFDPAAVSFVWGLGLWVVSGWSGWLTRRQGRGLWAVTPCGVLLMTAFSHVWGNHVYLLGLLLSGFLLLALNAYDKRIRRWHATNVDYPELRPQTITVTGFLALALVVVAHALPAFSLERIIDLAPMIGKERSAEAKDVAASLGLEERRQTVFQEAATGLPRRHLLDAGPDLSEQIVMVVSIEDRTASDDGAAAWVPPRYYWRSHTHDRYSGSGWASSDTKAVAYEAGAQAVTGTLPTQRVVRQEVRWLGRSSDLAHAAGTLTVADHDYTVAWRSPEDPFAVTIEATTYRADSLVPAASERELRQDRGSYPGWVHEHYLDLPEEVPSRVLALARDLTATADAPYDRARAIEAYLRQFPYTLDVPTPPGDRDVVDYFLFDLKRGYCDYYASAMVVLARAAGLPARLAVGYATGSYDAAGGRYVVAEADAHAWPEIYFPAHGWVSFEPTSRLQRFKRAGAFASLPLEPEGQLEPARREWWSWVRCPWWWFVLASLVVAGLTGAAWHGWDRWWLGHREPAVVVGGLYRRLRASGRRLGVPMAVGDTPREFGAALASSLAMEEDRSERGREAQEATDRRYLVDLVAAGADEVTWLTAIYGRASYSPRPPGAAERTQALQIWERLQWRLRLARLMRMLRLKTKALDA